MGFTTTSIILYNFLKSKHYKENIYFSSKTHIKNYLQIWLLNLLVKEWTDYLYT